MLFKPKPRADHVVPFHLAIRLAVTPPAFVNNPVAYNSLLKIAKSCTTPFIPEPNAVQFVPFHFAIRFTVTPPAVVKSPPTMRLPSKTITVHTYGPFTPLPNAAKFCASELLKLTKKRSDKIITIKFIFFPKKLLTCFIVPPYANA